MPGENLARKADGAHIDLRRPWFGDGSGEPARIAQRAHQADAGGINIVVRDVMQMRIRPGIEPMGEIAVAVLEERPLQKRQVGHQLPSNTGARRLANAS